MESVNRPFFRHRKQTAANPSATTSYNVIGTDANGCTNSASVTVTVHPLPVINASPATPVLCNGQSVTLTASGGNTYIWNPTTGLSSGTGAVVSANPSSSTIYNVIGTDANGCTNTASVSVTVNPKPVVTVSPNTPAICNGQAVFLTASGANSYIWNPSTGLPSSITGATVSANPSSSTTYSVLGTDINGCTNTGIVTVVGTLPTITASPSAPILCNGQSVSLTASGGSTYTWSPSTGLSSGSGTTVSANPSSSTTYNVIGTDSHRLHKHCYRYCYS